MRTHDVSVQTTGPTERRDRSAPTFRITYTGSDPRTVMRVNERLTWLFIEESLRNRTTLAEGTNQFLDAQLIDARSRLIEQEKRLEAYRQRHSGELPSQLSSNMQAMQNIQLQLQALWQFVGCGPRRHLALDRMVGEAEAMAAAVPAGALADGADTSTLTTEQQLELKRAELRALELRLKPGHPDLARAKRAIAGLEQRIERKPCSSR